MGYHLRVKICGVTNEIDAHLAALFGADAIGLNFYAHSSRCVDPVAANTILRELPPFVEAVGVFVHEPMRDIFLRVQTPAPVRRIQWHRQDSEGGGGYPYHL